MTIIRRRSPMFFTGSSVFAVFTICLIAGTEMAAAWKRDMCVDGDVYLDSQNGRKEKMDCKFCEKWCMDECSDMDLPAVSYGCRDGGDMRCKCCCGKSSPLSDPPTPPTLLPLSLNDFEGAWPHDYDICKPQEQEKYLKIKHPHGRHCLKRPECEERCQ
ncbi:hypothetical protein C5167_034953, partial [Papaver somniferum]